MAEKRKVSPQTRIKLSRAAKQRKRAPKGTPLGGHFLMGALPAFGVKRAGKLPERQRDIAVDALSRAQRRIRSDPENAARIMAAHETELITGVRPTRVDIEHAPVNVRSSAIKDVSTQSVEQRWRTERDVYRTEKPKSVSGFLTGTRTQPAPIAPSHKREVDRLLADPHSEFNRGLGMEARTKGRYNPGQRRRLEQYVTQLQQGRSHQEALQSLTVERRGRPTGAAAAPAVPVARSRAEYALDTAERQRRTPTRKSKYEQAGTRRPHELQFGIGIKTAQSIDQLGDIFPAATDKELIQIQEAQKQYLLEEYQKNQRWAQETRRANILGREGKDSVPDRVVFFTTSLGEPSASVPTDSLVGQYIIRKRRKAAESMGFTATDLRGKFPEALRDMHVFQASTGMEYGVSGEHGVYHRTGFRVGSKTSRGYGRPVPVGSQIMYDSQGRPVYDDAGNVRFTEGATRKFSQRSRPLGLGVFIG